MPASCLDPETRPRSVRAGIALINRGAGGEPTCTHMHCTEPRPPEGFANHVMKPERFRPPCVGPFAGHVNQAGRFRLAARARTHTSGRIPRRLRAAFRLIRFGADEAVLTAAL